MTRPSDEAMLDAPFRSAAPAGRAGFGALLKSEWTKFRTVRGWLVALLVAGLVTFAVGALSATGSKRECAGPDGQPCAVHIPPVGPNGQSVTDRFTFVHQDLPGDGTVTARVSSLTGDGAAPEPWAKAGLIVKADLTEGSRYAAVMLTGGHGVRWQYDFTADAAGTTGDAAAPSTAPRWLRLTRSGDTIAGYDSADGVSWNAVGTATIPFPGTVQIGMFVTSPDHTVTVQRFGGTETNSEASQAIAAFDNVAVNGGAGDWADTQVGGDDGGPGPTPNAGFTEANGTFTITGSGDIAPAVAGPEGNTVERSLAGVFAGLIVVMVLGSVFITSEYRRGLIRTTLAARPQRGQLLAAKALVIGVVTFVVGVITSALTFWIVGAIRRANGVNVMPVSWQTDLRVIAGTAALLAVSSVFALAVGTLLRRAVGAVTITVVLVVLPYVLAVASVLPSGAAQWLLRVTPAAGFAIQQSTPVYQQVDATYLPSSGYFPLSPLGGFAVLCGWTALALALAAVSLRRRDAAA
ncbi:ABC transporter permease subunit [Nakamurella lactea]|uniref:ABC transporter permease subunit n=1 Tax=Nakamurella lactea TaxID=459515 RepID=UPI0004107F25|nr:ABC transporter permease subunit [Nakamurella lactea]